MIALATAGATAADYAVGITKDQEVYSLPATAVFDVRVYRNGELLPGGNELVEAFFPDDLTPVELQEVEGGIYQFVAELLTPGQKTLTVTVRADHPEAIPGMERTIERAKQEIAALVEALSGETRPNRICVLEHRIELLQRLVERFEAMIAGFQAPVAMGTTTILVVETPVDVTPPEFGCYLPPLTNGHRSTKDPFAPVWVEVSDDESGVASVDLCLDGSPDPISMAFDGVAAIYVPESAWTEAMHSVRIEAKDEAANESVLEFWFAADRTAPEITSFSPESTSDPTPLIVVGVIDPLSYVGRVTVALGSESVTVVPGGVEFATVGLQIQNSLPVFVPQTVHITMEDMAGNLATETRTIIVVP